MEKLNITLENGISILEVRQGDALPLEPTKIVSIGGQITAPADFFKARATEIKPLGAMLVISMEQGVIKLNADETNPRGAVISGSLKDNKDLAGFNINTGNLYPKKGLQELLKRRRMFFADRAEYDKIMVQLEAYTYSQTANGTDNDDKRGNTKFLKEKTHYDNLQKNFYLIVPLFEGTEPVRFMVEIGVDTSTAETRFWLESIDLLEMQKNAKEKLINEQLEAFRDSGIATLYV